MAFISTIGFIILGALLLVVGLLSGSSWAYLGAALCSAIAVGVLWVKTSRSDRKVEVKNLPVQQTPSWDKPVRNKPPREPEEPGRSELPVVAISDYENLLASEIIPNLETLSVEQLREIVKREKLGLSRPAIIERAETLIDLTAGASREPVVPQKPRVRHRRDDGEISLR